MTGQIPPQELAEKDFINEGYTKNPLPLWLWLFLLTALLALIWGGSNWYSGKINLLVHESPFLQVSNRQMSLFLWQNPEFMRINSKQKNGYLPAFQYLDKITIDLPQADENVVAPPELLFRYHTWDRLVSKEFAERPIHLQEFRDFLSYAEEWQPRYWPAATADYANMVDKLSTTKIQDLSVLSMQELPLDVRMAFQGWMNYFKDGEAINQFKPTYAQIRDFLIKNPNYARNYWLNIVKDSYPDYLKGLTPAGGNEEVTMPQNELTSFLRVAAYNYFMSKKNPPRSARDDIKLNVKKQNAL